MRRLICAFVVSIWHKQVFSWRGSYIVQKDYGNCIKSNHNLGSALNWSMMTILLFMVNLDMSLEEKCYMVNIPNSKKFGHRKIYCNYLKIWRKWFYQTVMQMERQTVLTLIEQSNLGLHCLTRSVCPKPLQKLFASTLSSFIDWFGSPPS